MRKKRNTIIPLRNVMKSHKDLVGIIQNFASALPLLTQPNEIENTFFSFNSLKLYIIFESILFVGVKLQCVNSTLSETHAMHMLTNMLAHRRQFVYVRNHSCGSSLRRCNGMWSARKNSYVRYNSLSAS